MSVMRRWASLLARRCRSTGTAAATAATPQRVQYFGAQRQKLVILGSGWGATSLLKGIDVTKYDVTVVSPRNHFLMTALLPGVTVGTVEGRSIVEPMRQLLPGKKHPEDARFYEATALDVDPRAKTVTCRDLSELTSDTPEFTLSYDRLVVSVGAPFNTYRAPGVEKYAIPVKEVDDALRVRRRLIDMLETASLPGPTTAERRRMCAVVVVGGGPIGVSIAAEIHDFLNQDVPKLYPELKGIPSVTIVHANDHILNVYDERISKFAEDKFSRDNILLLKGRYVRQVHPKELWTNSRKTGECIKIPFGVCIWATGLGANPFTRRLQEALGHMERRAVAVDKCLRVRGAEGIYALGDCADVKDCTVLADSARDLFKRADIDNSGTIGEEELRLLLIALQDSHPHVTPLLRKKGWTVKGLMKRAARHRRRREEATGADEKEDETVSVAGETLELTYEEFLDALIGVDARASSFPATAQVAAQQGAYLAKTFNTSADVPPGVGGDLSSVPKAAGFRYRHLGYLSQLGGGVAVMDAPGNFVWTGFSTMFLWYSAYFSEQVSWRNRWLVLWDWSRYRIFGRDNSQI